MDELTTRLQALGINYTPTPKELAKLVERKEKAKARGKELAAKKPMTPDKLALLQWAKDNKALTDQYKQSLGARAIHGTKMKGGVQVPTVKYVVSDSQKANYSAWLKQQMASAQTAYVQKAQAQQAISANIVSLQQWLQSGSPPKYLSSLAKTYIKDALAKGAKYADMQQYCLDNWSYLPYGTLDPDGQVVTGSKPALPPPTGIAQIPARVPSKSKKRRT